MLSVKESHLEKLFLRNGLYMGSLGQREMQINDIQEKVKTRIDR